MANKAQRRRDEKNGTGIKTNRTKENLTEETFNMKDVLEEEGSESLREGMKNDGHIWFFPSFPRLGNSENIKRLMIERINQKITETKKFPKVNWQLHFGNDIEGKEIEIYGIVELVDTKVLTDLFNMCEALNINGDTPETRNTMHGMGYKIYKSDPNHKAQYLYEQHKKHNGINIETLAKKMNKDAV